MGAAQSIQKITSAVQSSEAFNDAQHEASGSYIRVEGVFVAIANVAERTGQ